MHRYLILLITFLVMSSAWAQETTPESTPDSIDVQVTFNAAVIAYWRLDDNAALVGFNTVIEAQSNFAEAWAYRGALYRALGDYSAAQNDFAQALVIDPDNATAYALRSRLSFSLGDERQALRDANRAIRLDPALGLAFASRAILYLSLDEGQKAILDYTRAIELAPDFAPFYNNRGLAYEFTDNPESALADYETANRLDPLYAVPLENAAYVLIAERQFPEAIERLSAALELWPEAGHLYLRRGQLYALIGEADLAQADFARAEELGTPLPGESS